MQNTHSLGAAEIARQSRQILKQTAARMAGKQRGPDHDPENMRRVPHRNSYDVDDQRAKPWRRICDGSIAQGHAHRAALLKIAEELYHRGWRDNPNERVREARARHAALTAELEAHLAAKVHPPGRLAAIRMELAPLEQLLKRAARRLRRIDVTVLKALIEKIDFATGKLFPAIDTIAQDAGCHRNSVLAALVRLKAHGLISWVRRSTRTGNEGHFAPQREQTSNAYFFEHQERMEKTTWQRFVQLLTIKLRRLGAAPDQESPPRPRQEPNPALAAALGRLGDALGYPPPNAST